MENTEFNRIFRSNLKINMRSISVKTLLSERNLSRINYKPYYQRNYVWDATKATFFIESILLGTDIPPLILFKSGNKIEVIDGRQRFETLKRFKEAAFKLTSKGLIELKILKDNNFNDISHDVKEAFLDTKVRLFEFEVVNEPRLSEELEDKIKKEIFRRYNTGITPINSMELDNAKYDDDSLTHLIKDHLEQDKSFTADMINCFFSNKKAKSDISISALTDFIRRFITITDFPIISYAGSGSRTDIRELLYEFISSNIENINEFFEKFKKIIKKVIVIHKSLSSTQNLENKLIYECLLWGISILDKEDIKVEVNDELCLKLEEHYLKNIETYSIDNSHYYAEIIKRYEDTADLFSEMYNVDLSLYIKDDKFGTRIKDLKQTEEDGLLKMSVLDKLRLLKPEPSSEPIEEVVSDLNSRKYNLRPSYQRQERISIKKASSIIESILLGIYLPPIFIFKNEHGIREVIDGQQRLLSILAFMGKPYLNEKGITDYSKNNNFSLKGLSILTDLNGRKFSEIPSSMSEKIYDFDLNIIEIDHKLNRNFNPVDLFIRLNNKPYPIKENSFEMWNSSVSNDVITLIKEITKENINWFYLRVVKKDRISDRMENEEMITVLSYLDYLKSSDISHRGVEFYLKQDRLNCRITNKSAISSFLNSLEDNIKRMNIFIESVKNTELFIKKVKSLLNTNEDELAATLNDKFNVKNIQAFKRSLQDIYLLWMLINPISIDCIEERRLEILESFNKLISVMKNINSNTIDDAYMNEFTTELEREISNYVS